MKNLAMILGVLVLGCGGGAESVFDGSDPGEGGGDSTSSSSSDGGGGPGGNGPGGSGVGGGECVPKSCADLGANCGAIDDGCGNMLDCGGCSGDYAGCKNNSCVIDCHVLSEDGCAPNFALIQCKNTTSTTPPSTGCFQKDFTGYLECTAFGGCWCCSNSVW